MIDWRQCYLARRWLLSPVFSGSGTLLLLVLTLLPVTVFAVDLSDASKAVVKLFVTHQSWDMKQPWTKSRSVSSSCTGFFIEQGILTNAHCVTDSTYIQVELAGVPDKVEAVRKAVNHQVDLALIELKDPSQYPDITTVTFDDLPEMRDKVVTVGYPTGGRQVSYTEGVVSRIDVMGYAYSNVASLMVQTDAAINVGNSGGPVFSDRTGASLGVATQRSNHGEAIGYFIPSPVIRQFLTDIEDGTVDGIPTLAGFFQGMENPAQRTSMNMTEEQSGARFLIAAKDGSVDGLLKQDDVLLSIEGHQVYNDGRVPFRNDSKIDLGYYVVTRQVGDKIKIEVLRKGKKKELAVPLKGMHTYLIPAMPQFEVKPRYYEVGGLVFRDVERRYIGSLGKNTPGGIQEYFGVIQGEEDIDELVVIGTVFDASVNKGYRGSVENMRVLDINGKPIRKLEDVKKAFESGKKRDYHQITLANRATVVLDRKQVDAEQAAIRKRYEITEYQP
jgi:S1-C subfamily serine protease